MKRLCECGCGQEVSGLVRGKPRRYVSGHNLRGLPRTEEHRRKIGEAQRRAWSTSRQRLPVGATYKDSDGYIRVKVVAGKGKWRPQHVLVMEEVLGRSLTPGEIVHHINGVRDDNRPENLFLCEGHSHHVRIERSLAEMVRELLARGEVVFNREIGRYEWADSPQQD